MQITHTQKKICKDLEIKNLGKYHNLYVQIDTLLPMHLKTFGISVLNYMSFVLLIFFLNQDYSAKQS